MLPYGKNYVGTQIGNYQITQFIGHLGYSQTYLGIHKYLNIPAVIKTSTLENTNLLLHEAQITAQLVHPNIIQVLDYVIIENVEFLVMTYTPNGNLRERHPEGTRLRPEVILPYVKQIASALQYAHNQGIIHCDVRPTNMLIGRNGEILLSHFTLSMSEKEERQEAVTKLLMLPEILPGKASKASDQYSLGVNVYEWLCGELPYMLAYQHQTVSSPPLHTILRDIQPLIESVVMTALAKEPNQRFSSVQAFATAFEQACQADPSNLPRIFVSHSSKDNAFGAKLIQELQRAIGSNDAVWYDTSGGLKAGDAWWEKIKQELRDRPVFIVVLSPDALASGWVRDEINMAWRQKNSALGKRIIPILYEECNVPEDLGTLQVISFLAPKPYEIARNELLNALGLPTR